MRLSDAIAGYWLEKRLEFVSSGLPRYEVTFRRLVEFLCDAEIESVTSTDIRRFLAHIESTYNLSKRSVHDSWIPLSSLWTWAETELGIAHIIRGKVKRPAFTKRTIEPFTLDEIRRILRAVGRRKAYETKKGATAQLVNPFAERDRAIILTLVDSGLRASELCALTVGDYDAQRGRLHVAHGKGDKERFVTVGARTQKAIWRYLTTRPRVKRNAPLFATRSEQHIRRDNLRKMLVSIGERGDVSHVHPHRFRHTFAITFLRNGGNVLTLKELLGHESLAMVMHYARVAEQDIDAAQRHSPADNWRL